MAVTAPTDVDPLTWLRAVVPPRRREEGLELLELWRDASGEPAVMWGPSIVGFGVEGYTLASGRSATTLRSGFSPRKAALSLYGLTRTPAQRELLESLGPHRLGASCLYVTSLARADLGVLADLIRAAHR